MRPRWSDVHDRPTKGDSPFVATTKFLVYGLDRSARVVGICCLAAMFVGLLGNVILRYVFGTGLPWAYEIHAVLLPWLVAAGVVVASAQGGHITISILYDAAGPRLAPLLLLIIQIAIVIVSVAILWSSPPILRAAGFQRLATLGITQIWGYASLIYAFAGMGLIAFLDALRLLVDKPTED